MARTFPVSAQDAGSGDEIVAAPRQRRLRLPTGLPTLAGRALLVFRLLWWGVFAVALFALLWSTYDEYRQSVEPRPVFAEFGLRYTAPLQIDVQPDGPASRAGLTFSAPSGWGSVQ